MVVFNSNQYKINVFIDKLFHSVYSRRKSQILSSITAPVRLSIQFCIKETQRLQRNTSGFNLYKTEYQLRSALKFYCSHIAQYLHSRYLIRIAPRKDNIQIRLPMSHYLSDPSVRPSPSRLSSSNYDERILGNFMIRYKFTSFCSIPVNLLTST